MISICIIEMEEALSTSDKTIEQVDEEQSFEWRKEI